LDVFPGVSLIVTCRNNAETIRECLQTLRDQNYPKNKFEIIVIDACSTDGTAEIAKEFTSQVYSLPLNAAAAYNYAMKLASFSILGFVDADAKVESDWLPKIVPSLADQVVAGVSGAIETWNVQNPWARSIGYEIKNRYDRLGQFAGRIATMNLLMKKSVILEVGGWDESFPSQYDTDLGYRVSGRGYRFAYVSSAKCYHFNRQSVKAYWRQQLQYGKNTLRLYLKHGRLARGDEITDWGMNAQPAVLLAIIVLFSLGIVPLLRPLWCASGLGVLAIFIYYLISAARISARFKDKVGFRLVALYFVRSVAWLLGAGITAFNSLAKRRSK
jgi:cellulose synthase/poly-beta-1,6-N-acetylglucosamine synthase-like glycosyltransferase